MKILMMALSICVVVAAAHSQDYQNPAGMMKVSTWRQVGCARPQHDPAECTQKASLLRQSKPRRRTLEYLPAYILAGFSLFGTLMQYAKKRNGVRAVFYRVLAVLALILFPAIPYIAAFLGHYFGSVSSPGHEAKIKCLRAIGR